MSHLAVRWTIGTPLASSYVVARIESALSRDEHCQMLTDHMPHNHGFQLKSKSLTCSSTNREHTPSQLITGASASPNASHFSPLTGCDTNRCWCILLQPPRISYSQAMPEVTSPRANYSCFGTITPSSRNGHIRGDGRCSRSRRGHTGGGEESWNAGRCWLWYVVRDCVSTGFNRVRSPGLAFV